jgi:hypothetical protein
VSMLRILILTSVWPPRAVGLDTSTSGSGRARLRIQSRSFA